MSWRPRGGLLGLPLVVSGQELERLRRAVDKAAEQPAGHRAMEKRSGLTTGPRHKTKAVLSDQLRNASELIRRRTENAASRNLH